MLIQFKEGFTEFANGGYHRKNDGQPFQVDTRFAKEELLPSGVFEIAPEPKKEEKKKDVKPKENK